MNEFARRLMEPDFRPAPTSELWECLECGAIVADRERHWEWHGKQPQEP